MSSVLYDLRFAVRSLRRRRTFAAVAIATIAVAIGAATAIYSVVDGVLFRSLPLPKAGRLVSVWQSEPERRTQPLLSALWDRVPLDYTDFITWRAKQTSYTGVGVWSGFGAMMAGVRGPEQLRGPFQSFGEDYRASGRFGESLDRLKVSLADPVADRIIESLRVAREVGGTDLGRLLRTLSQFLREDARTRAELETRQGWTVNAARLALCAPWAVLGMLALRPETVVAYNSATGVLVLLVGGGVSLLAYRVMLRIARLPEEDRVLR